MTGAVDIKINEEAGTVELTQAGVTEVVSLDDFTRVSDELGYDLRRLAHAERRAAIRAVTSGKTL